MKDPGKWSGSTDYIIRSEPRKEGMTMEGISMEGIYQVER